MDSEEATLKEPRVISKAAFEILVVLTFILLTILEIAAVLALNRALGHRLAGGTVGAFLVAPSVIVSRLAVDRVLKRFGLSRSGKTMERRGRTVATAEGEVDDDEVVEVRLPKSLLRFLFWWGSLVAPSLPPDRRWSRLWNPGWRPSATS